MDRKTILTYAFTSCRPAICLASISTFLLIVGSTMFPRNLTMLAALLFGSVISGIFAFRIANRLFEAESISWNLFVFVSYGLMLWAMLSVVYFANLVRFL